jgi:hypothetical protein
MKVIQAGPDDELFTLSALVENKDWTLQIGEPLQNGKVIPVSLTLTGPAYHKRKVMKVSEEITYGGLLMTSSGLTELKWNLDYRLGGQLPG